MATVTEATGSVRYACIKTKCPREIVLLRGTGCKWKRCRFCDYHLDAGKDIEENFQLNAKVLSYVKGTYGALEVINSGSFTDLDEKTMALIIATCTRRHIKCMHIEFHWMDRGKVAALKQRFAEKGITLWTKMGVETFDIPFRKSYLDKGIDTPTHSPTPQEISRYADEVNLLVGLPGQSVGLMRTDIRIALKHFKRACVNIMTPNRAPIQPDDRVIERFKRYLLAEYADEPRLDILCDNSSWGLGEATATGEVAKQAEKISGKPGDSFTHA